MTDHPVINLAQALVMRPSVTPEDMGCQQLIADRLVAFGFVNEHLRFDEVDNLWATHGSQSPVFVFAGHTDVVPAGHEDQWLHSPFSGLIENGFLHGRGSADMKGSVAAMVCALEEFVNSRPDHNGTIALLLTSDEEGSAINGTRKVIEHLIKQGTYLDYCLIGEPSSSESLGDTIKIGRRGSISGRLTIHGKQGHIAYPHMAENPIHRLGNVINKLIHEHWDYGNDFFPPTSLQIANISAGDGTVNVIPGQARLNFNLRYSSELDEHLITKRTHEILDSLPIRYDLEWQAYGKPFITQNGRLIDAAKQVIDGCCGLNTSLSTSGGTSDGRFIAPTGTQVIELGPINKSIHKFNEHVAIDDLVKLKDMYIKIAERLLG